TPAGLLPNSPRSFTRPGMSRGGKAAWPCESVKCNPTPSRGCAFAKATASSNAASFTIRLAVVRMPSVCARMTASLMDGVRPKSSALTISRRGRSGRSIVRSHQPGGGPQAGLEQQQQLLAFAEPRRLGTEDVELLPLQLAQQPPVN